MADAKIDKSLDEIIKERNIRARQPRQGGGGGGRGRGGPGGAARRANSNGRFNRPNNNNNNNNNRFPRRSGGGGGIQKRRSGGGNNNSPKKAAAAAASMNGQWDHDLYQNSRRSSSAGGSSNGPAKLVISNLDFGVNDQDIRGLFQEFGNIRKASVHYDRSGRSLGTADVLFERKQDAIRALKKYNGVSLDGRPMDIQLTTPLAVPVMNRPRPRGGSAPARGRGRGGRQGGNGGGNNRGGPRQNNKPAKSAADLDADLDAYNAKMQTD